MKVGFVCCLAFLAMLGCDLPGASSPPSPSASGSPVFVGKLDPQVAMPAGFPTDVPVYPGARLVGAAAFPSGSKTTWGMEWETLDGASRVQPFYIARLNQGDWKVVFGGTSPSGAYSAVFSRQSDSTVSGILGIVVISSVTKITMSLLTHT